MISRQNSRHKYFQILYEYRHVDNSEKKYIYFSYFIIQYFINTILNFKQTTINLQLVLYFFEWSKKKLKKVF